jgi:hypothetical protein
LDVGEDSTTTIPKTNRYRLVFFRLYPPVLVRIPSVAALPPFKPNKLQE